MESQTSFQLRADVEIATTSACEVCFRAVRFHPMMEIFCLYGFGDPLSEYDPAIEMLNAMEQLLRNSNSHCIV
jgi:hypothetical protein